MYSTYYKLIGNRLVDSKNYSVHKKYRRVSLNFYNSTNAIVYLINSFVFIVSSEIIQTTT